MRISDWSSDVCSSDLTTVVDDQEISRANRYPIQPDDVVPQFGAVADELLIFLRNTTVGALTDDPPVDIDRKSGVSGTSVSVRVDLGGRRILTNKNIVTTSKKKHTLQLVCTLDV